MTSRATESFDNSYGQMAAPIKPRLHRSVEEFDDESVDENGDCRYYDSDGSCTSEGPYDEEFGGNRSEDEYRGARRPGYYDNDRKGRHRGRSGGRGSHGGTGAMIRKHPEAFSAKVGARLQGVPWQDHLRATGGQAGGPMMLPPQSMRPVLPGEDSVQFELEVDSDAADLGPEKLRGMGPGDGLEVKLNLAPVFAAFKADAMLIQSIRLLGYASPGLDPTATYGAHLVSESGELGETHWFKERRVFCASVQRTQPDGANSRAGLVLRGGVSPGEGECADQPRLLYSLGRRGDRFMRHANVSHAKVLQSLAAFADASTRFSSLPIAAHDATRWSTGGRAEVGSYLAAHGLPSIAKLHHATTGQHLSIDQMLPAGEGVLRVPTGALNEYLSEVAAKSSSQEFQIGREDAVRMVFHRLSDGDWSDEYAWVTRAQSNPGMPVHLYKSPRSFAVRLAVEAIPVARND